MLSTLLVSDMSVGLSSSLLFFLTLFSGTTVAQTTVTVASAADLAPLQPDLRKAFLHLRFVTSASAILSQQIENGAPYDVFLSANAAFVDQLAKNQKIEPDSVRIYAKGRLGILWRDGRPHEISHLADSEVRSVSLADPKLAPYGVAARQTLEHAGIWPQVQPKVIYGENVRQALQLFTSGNADAVLTSGSLLVERNPQWIPDSWHQPILQKAGILAASKQGEAARKFLDFLIGPAGQKIFAKYGFLPVAAPQ